MEEMQYPITSRVMQLKDAMAKVVEQRRDDLTLQRLHALTVEYVDNVGIQVCNISARDLSKLMLLKVTRGENPVDGSVKIWYGEIAGIGPAHAVALFETYQADYYIDPIGFTPFGLKPGIRVIQKGLPGYFTDRPVRQFTTPPLDRHSLQLQNQGKPVGNEIVLPMPPQVA